MITSIDRLLENGCSPGKKDKVCRSRGGESCAFDGAMIVLQPIADAAQVVHGPIACCGNSWEGRGSLSDKGHLHRRGFTTDLSELDIVYGAEDKLLHAIHETAGRVRPKAIFVHATCVSGLIGEDIDAVCKKAQDELGIRVIPVHAPGFAGPKNLGNRIAGEVLLEHVIGTGEPPLLSGNEINLIGEYNIAGDLRHIEPLLVRSGFSVLSRMTGNATFEETTWAHRARLNVVVCSRALINVAREMERRYGIPFVEVSFFGATEISRGLRLIAGKGIEYGAWGDDLLEKVEETLAVEEQKLAARLRGYEHLRGKKAVLYSGGVKSWSFISALRDLGIEIVAVGTKKSSYEDEEKMRALLGPDAPLVEDVSPKSLLRLLRERHADILIAGGRNQYLAVKEGYPFVDVNQERHIAYAGYEGLVNLAGQISSGIRFYEGETESETSGNMQHQIAVHPSPEDGSGVLIDPMKHSPFIGAAMALQGIHRALPVIHGAQGCTFLGKVLLTKHFREPIALASTKLFTEDVVMGSEEVAVKAVKGLIDSSHPEVIAVLTSGLAEVKGDDLAPALKALCSEYPECSILHIPTPDYAGGLEDGYAGAVEALLELAEASPRKPAGDGGKRINVLVGPHFTPADCSELREIIGDFGLAPILLPDLSALDGSRQGISALALGGTRREDLRQMGSSVFTLAIGRSMEKAASRLEARCSIGYEVLDSVAGIRGTKTFMETLASLSGRHIPPKYARQEAILKDGMRDAHFFYGDKRICVALDRDLASQLACLLKEAGAEVVACDTKTEGLSSLTGGCDLLISNSHAEDTARELRAPLYQMGFPVYKILGATAGVTIGYRGSLRLINEIANTLMKG